MYDGGINVAGSHDVCYNFSVDAGVVKMTKTIVKNKIIEFIKKPIPVGNDVVTRSVPICFFGDIENAKIATLSLNPSDKEFRNTQKRLVDRDWLPGCPSDTSALSEFEACEVYDSCIDYFQNNPYKAWFGSISNKNGMSGFMKRKYDASYYEGTLVHLDITPWATKQKWRKLSDSTKNALVREYASYLKFVLDNSDFDVIYVNGKAVKEALETALNIQFTMTPIKLPINSKSEKYECVYNNKTHIVGINHNFQHVNTIPGFVDALIKIL